ncbi:hypothetical protein PINS_up006647 [Pythium insidiosum]|nr:hypothetical protein PINS_up006647 [Pythium insidiosum]
MHAVDPPPEASDDVDMDDDSLPMSGFVAFVAYPRRFVMYRRRDFQPIAAKKYGTHSVVAGSLSSLAHAQDATFAFTTALMTHPNCVATADTIREAALSFQDHYWDSDKSELRKPNLKREINLLPATWTTQFDEPGAAQHIDVVAPSGVSWRYTLDSEMRVTRVEGLSTTKDDSERDYDEEYADIMLGAFFNANSAAMDAGHLIAQQQNPPLFFFNYVPQHYNSNRGSSCWYNTEMIVGDLIVEMKCPVQYLVRLDYSQNGIQKPTEMGGLLPAWAVTSNLRKDPDIKTYSKNEYICHYRYRPFTISIDFQITSHVTGTPCMNLHRALQVANMPSMFTIVGDRIRTSRLFAFHTATPSSADLTRLFSAATAKHKVWNPTLAASQRMCYAETGNIADFEGVELTYDFFQAFLDYKSKGGYYALSIVGKEDRWSRGDPQNVEGQLIHEKPDQFGNDCLQLQNGQLSLGSMNCGRFRYMYSATYLDKDQAVLTKGVSQPQAHPGNGQADENPLPMSSTAPGVKSLVQGIVVFPSGECLHDGPKDPVAGPKGQKCLVFGLTHGGS